MHHTKSSPCNRFIKCSIPDMTQGLDGDVTFQIFSDEQVDLRAVSPTYVLHAKLLRSTGRETEMAVVVEDLQHPSLPTNSRIVNGWSTLFKKVELKLKHVGNYKIACVCCKKYAIRDSWHCCFAGAEVLVPRYVFH